MRPLPGGALQADRPSSYGRALRVAGSMQLPLKPESPRKPTHVLTILGGDQGDAHAATASTPCAPDAMDVCVVIAGRVEVDYVRYPLDVDPACRDVGGHERVHASRLEAGERLLALAL